MKEKRNKKKSWNENVVHLEIKLLIHSSIIRLFTTAMLFLLKIFPVIFLVCCCCCFCFRYPKLITFIIHRVWKMNKFSVRMVDVVRSVFSIIIILASFFCVFSFPNFCIYAMLPFVHKPFDAHCIEIYFTKIKIYFIALWVTLRKKKCKSILYFFYFIRFGAFAMLSWYYYELPTNIKFKTKQTLFFSEFYWMHLVDVALR